MFDLHPKIIRDDLWLLLGDLCCLAMLLIVAVALITLAP